MSNAAPEPRTGVEIMLHGPDGGTVLAHVKAAGYVADDAHIRGTTYPNAVARPAYTVAIEACNLSTLPAADRVIVPASGGIGAAHTEGLARELGWLTLAQLRDAGNDPDEWWSLHDFRGIGTAAGRDAVRLTLTCLDIGQRHAPTLDRYEPMMRQATGDGEGCCVPSLAEGDPPVCGRATAQGRGLCDGHRTHGPLSGDAILTELLLDWQRAESPSLLSVIR